MKLAPTVQSATKTPLYFEVHMLGWTSAADVRAADLARKAPPPNAAVHSLQQHDLLPTIVAPGLCGFPGDGCSLSVVGSRAGLEGFTAQYSANIDDRVSVYSKHSMYHCHCCYTGRILSLCSMQLGLPLFYWHGFLTAFNAAFVSVAMQHLVIVLKAVGVTVVGTLLSFDCQELPVTVQDVLTAAHAESTAYMLTEENHNRNQIPRDTAATETAATATAEGDVASEGARIVGSLGVLGVRSMTPSAITPVALRGAVGAVVTVKRIVTHVETGASCSASNVKMALHTHAMLAFPPVFYGSKVPI